RDDDDATAAAGRGRPRRTGEARDRTAGARRGAARGGGRRSGGGGGGARAARGGRGARHAAQGVGERAQRLAGVRLDDEVEGALGQRVDGARALRSAYGREGGDD